MSEEEINEVEKPPTLWAALEEQYKNYYPGLIVQGMILLDVTDGENRTLRFMTSPDSTSWNIKGMVSEIVSQLDAETVADMVFGVAEGEEELDELDEDDD